MHIFFYTRWKNSGKISWFLLHPCHIVVEFCFIVTEIVTRKIDSHLWKNTGNQFFSIEINYFSFSYLCLKKLLFYYFHIKIRDFNPIQGVYLVVSQSVLEFLSMHYSSSAAPIQHHHVPNKIRNGNKQQSNCLFSGISRANVSIRVHPYAMRHFWDEKCYSILVLNSKRQNHL